MPILKRDESYEFKGDVNLQNAKSLNLAADQIGKEAIGRLDEEPIAIPFTRLRIWDNLAAGLPATPATDDIGIVHGTYGTDAPVLQTANGGTGGITAYARLLLECGTDWIEGETLKIRARAIMDTAVADTSCYLDMEGFVPDTDGSVGSDICATSQQDMNSLTRANYDFEFTTTNMTHGEQIDIRISIAITDAATGTVIGEISDLRLLRDVR